MQKLLVIGFVWPEPNTTAAGNRMMQLLTVFKQRKFRICFASTASKTKYSENLEVREISEKEIILNHSSFDTLVKDFDPSIVIFDRFMVEEQFGWRVAEACPDALRILNTEDLHSLRDYREKCLKQGKQAKDSDWVLEDKTLREIASIYRSDLTLLVSTHEVKLLQELARIPKTLLFHLPFMLNEIRSTHSSNWPRYEERQDFISFGNGKHTPNVDSFAYLKTKIWPLIRQRLPEAKLYIYGAYLPQHTLEMNEPKQGFFVHGWVEDLKEVVQKSRVVLAPLRYGAGIKGKLTMAMQCGTPSITTSVGAEGMQSENAWPGFVAIGADEIADKAVQLYKEPSLWHEAQAEGILSVNTFYNSEKLNIEFFEQIELKLQNLKSGRAKNVVGALLRHQNFSATKYMGKWIEEKNKNLNR